MDKIIEKGFFEELIKIAKEKSDLEYAFHNALAGAAGGAGGAVLTQPIDTISNVGQNQNLSIKKSIKEVNRQALENLVKSKGHKIPKKLSTETLKNMTKDYPKIDKVLSHLNRYNKGLGAKMLKIAPATGVSFAIYQGLTHNLFNDKND